jgi:hypothetical protein
MFMPTERFRNKEAYRRNLAYRHIHHIPMTAKNVVVGGKKHKVKHSKKKTAHKRVSRKG